MITLKTLAQATEQEVFEQVARHLLTQKEKSAVGDTDSYELHCKYKLPIGLKCAAGCLIGDDEYNSCFEDDAWDTLVKKYDEFPSKHIILIIYLQGIHDRKEVKDWKQELIYVSTRFPLINTDFIEKEF